MVVVVDAGTDCAGSELDARMASVVYTEADTGSDTDWVGTEQANTMFMQV